MIEVRDLSVVRGGRLVLDQVSLEAGQGVTIGVVGPNGAGKSTLLQTLYQALPTTQGEVLLDGQRITGLARRTIAKRIAVVSQEPEPGLPLTVRDAVMLGRLAHRSLAGYGDHKDRGRVDAALARVDLDGFAERLVTELSGGERQRVLIARAIVQEAGHLLLDEPTNHLDIHHQFTLLNLVATLKSTTLVVLHDLNLAARCCDAVVLLDGGRVVASGPPEEVFTPERLSEVYRVGVRRISHAGGFRLLFDPLPEDQEGREPHPSRLSTMKETSMFTPVELMRAWDAQQEAFIEMREQRTRCLLDALAARARQTGGPFRVIDLGCGPGTLTQAVLRRFPETSVTGIDRDPVLLRLARETNPFPDRVQWVDADLRDGAWLKELPEGLFDAVISATALHWLEPDELIWLHQRLARVLAPGGLYLNADHLSFDAISESWLATVSEEDRERVRQEHVAAGAMTWDAWWDAALAMPGWEEEATESRRRWQNKAPTTKVSVEFHLASLRAAGFAETAQIWQWFDDRIVLGRLPDPSGSSD